MLKPVPLMSIFFCLSCGAAPETISVTAGSLRALEPGAHLELLLERGGSTYRFSQEEGPLETQRIDLQVDARIVPLDVLLDRMRAPAGWTSIAIGYDDVPRNRLATQRYPIKQKVTENPGEP